MAVPLLLMVLALSALGGTSAVATFDSSNCNDTHPCCITADNVSVFMGPLTKTWCNIEYPVRPPFKGHSPVACRLICLRSMPGQRDLVLGPPDEIGAFLFAWFRSVFGSCRRSRK